MCRLLKLARSLYYYRPKPRHNFNLHLENAVIEAFKRSRNSYGTRKLKVVLKRQGLVASRRKIGEIMAKYGLVSSYTIKHYKPHKATVNNDSTANLVDRDFNKRKPLQVVVSDLTYVNAGGKWHYICLLVDVASRRIIGSAVGPRKDAKLVEAAFYSVKENLSKIGIFHTDRGSEFKNKIVDEIISTFGIRRSLSAKGCPYDNAVAEATNKILKTELISNKGFCDLNQLKLALFDYINWYNNVRIHGSIGYLTPNRYYQLFFDKVSS